MTHTPTHSELEAQWEQDFGDHEECPVCGTQCRDFFIGDCDSKLKKAAPQLLEALKAITATLSTYDNQGGKMGEGCNCDKCESRRIADAAIAAAEGGE